jgi:hypothetical protein
MTTSKNNLAGPSGSAAVGSLDSVLPVSPHRHRTVAGSLEQAGANSPLRGGPSAVVPPPESLLEKQIQKQTRPDLR